MGIIKWETVGQKLVKCEMIKIIIRKFRIKKTPYFAILLAKYGVFLTIQITT